eukprot:gene4650-32279_t
MTEARTQALPPHILLECSQPGIVMLPKPGPLPVSLVAAYLQKILGPSLENLNTLVCAHVDKVAYENVDIHAGRVAPVLNAVKSAERIVSGRGGYCFILVDAFAALLTHLGYTVSLHTAACGDHPQARKTWGNHVVAVVHFKDGTKRVADVGLGDGARMTFPPIDLKHHPDTPNINPASPATASPAPAPTPATPTTSPAAIASTSTSIAAGFDVSLASSAKSVAEFTDFHNHLWVDPASCFVSAGVIIHRKTPADEGAHVVLHVADTEEEWHTLVTETFGLELKADLSDDECKVLWTRVSSDHAAWLLTPAGKDFATA